MNWFVAKLIFEIETQDSKHPQFDEQLRLIEAVNEELALEMAYQLGSMQQEEIINSNNHQVAWKFVAVTEIENIGEIAHGKEIHYKINEPEQVEQYLALVSVKAAQLKNRKSIYQE
ncbi:DUF4288 domain-containing protein [Pedobacter arcticus]|uniref:DUF4288 domain-containing protein n=1 Tax=Pedobacter arcticus TaxID=752140 RepID=UPI000306A485|nr:DUF4288 domain-containing protein [Pedobacter arcticus]